GFLVYGPQSAENLQLGVDVIKVLGDFERLSHGHLGSLDGTHREKQHIPKCEEQTHLVQRAQTRLGIKMVQRPPDTIATLNYQSEMDPHGRVRGRKGNSERGVSSWGKGPVEGGANVIDLPNTKR